jgi:hypothetical protein
MAYQRSLRSQWGFLLFGLCVGLTLATKHNAILLPAVFVPHFGWAVWRARKDAGGVMTSLMLHRPQTLLGLIVVGPLVLLLLWPWLWFDTFAHVRDWMAFHTNHVHYNFEYLGKNWNAPPFPWHVPIVTTLFTVPVATIVAGFVGLFWVAKRYRCGERVEEAINPALLLFLSAGVAMGPFLLRTTPIFGAEKHWAPAIPSLCIFAGLGLVWSARSMSYTLLTRWPRLHRAFVRRACMGFLTTSVIAAAALEVYRSHPYSLSHYNALAGGAQGGADKGMNRQFWGYSASGVLPYLNRFSETGGAVAVYSHDASPAWPLYAEEGLLAKTLPDAGRELVGIRRSKIAIVIHERHFNRHDYLIWEAYQKVQPSFVLLHQGVPVVSVYVRDALLEPK